MNTNSFCKTQLLSDSPAEEDAFGSHKNVAKTIAKLIDEENGGKSIALTGSWGSGKSTVVDMLKKELDSSIGLFVFDAWAHEGDPLRRTFLEQLIDFLTEKEWIDNEKWEKEKLILSHKFLEQKIKSTPVLTHVGKAFAALAILMPLGYVMLSLSGKENILWYMPHIGFILALSPFIFLVFNLIKNYLHNRKVDEDDKIDELFSLIINHSKNTEISGTITTPDPTSIEFQSFFRRLLKDASLNDKSRKLLIVIDNLDRIDAKDALSIWATMRTFFDHNSMNNDESLSRLWLILPFDPIALNRLWHFDNDKGTNKKQNTNESLAQSFIDKSFQINFCVAPPVFSAWKDFMLKLLAEAFPDHETDDFYTIYRLFRLRALTDKKFPTPRDLKLFINQVGALHRQWCSEIPLSIQALYVILKRNNFDFEKDLIKDDILEANELSLIDPYYQKYLAALHFNVPVEESIQILMAPSIENALNEGDVDAIKELCNYPGFTQVCEHVIEDQCFDWSKSENKTILIAANTLSAIEKHNDPSWINIWNLLHKATMDIDFIETLDENMGNGFVQLIKHKKDTHFVQSIVEIIAESIQSFESDDQIIESAIIENWIKGVYPVLTELLNSDYQNVIDEYFCIDCSASNYIEIIKPLAENSEWYEIQPCFRTEAATSEVIAELVKISTDGTFDCIHSKIVEVMLRIEQDWPWSDLIVALNKRLQAPNHLKPSEIKSSINVLLNFDKQGNSDANTNLVNLTTHGHFLHHLHQINATKEWETFGFLLAPLIRTIPNGQVTQHIGDSQSGLAAFNAILATPTNYSEVVEKYIQLAVKFSFIDGLIKSSNEYQNISAFTNEVIKTISKRPDAHELLSPAQIISSHTMLKEALSDESFLNLIQQSIQEKSLVTFLMSNNFDVNISRVYSIVLKVLSQNNNDRHDFVDFLIKGFRGIRRETWESELINEGELTELLIYVVESGHKLNLTTNFQNALLIHSQYIIENDVELHYSEEQWKNVYGALDNHAKITFMKDLLDKIIESDLSVDVVLEIYGQLLKDEKLLVEVADRLIRGGFKRFIEKKNINELIWLNEVISDYPKILNTCGKSTKIDFERQIIDIWDVELNEEVKEILETIIVKLGINNQFAVELNSKAVSLIDLEKFDEAKIILDKATKINPQFAEAWNNRGKIYHKFENHEEALTSFDETIKINPNCAIAWHNKSRVLKDLGRNEEAEQASKKAQELDEQL